MESLQNVNKEPENKRSQIELLYRDLKVMLDDHARLREENERLRKDYTVLLRKCGELSEKNEWLENKMRGIIRG